MPPSPASGWTPQVHQRGGSPQRPDGSTGRSLGLEVPCSTGSGGGSCPRAGAYPPHLSASPHAASRIGPGAPRGASLPWRCGRPGGVGFSVVLPMASPVSSLSRRQQSPALSRSALRARDALVLEHLPLADAIASATARRLFPLVEREDLIQVAREALVRSAHRCRSGEPAEPYLRRCISGALQHHLRDRVRLVRVPRRLH